MHGALSDAGLKDLKALSKLTQLNLSGTQVSDAGLKHLKTLTDLRVLHLSRTKVTAFGIASLRKSLPKCNVINDDK